MKKSHYRRVADPVNEKEEALMEALVGSGRNHWTGTLRVKWMQQHCSSSLQLDSSWQNEQQIALEKKVATNK